MKDEQRQEARDVTALCLCSSFILHPSSFRKGTIMAKQVTAQIRLQVSGGQATPAPPVGPALGQHGVNIGQFVSRFNDQTKDNRGVTVPVVITVYNDRSFEF